MTHLFDPLFVSIFGSFFHSGMLAGFGSRSVRKRRSSWMTFFGGLCLLLLELTVASCIGSSFAFINEGLSGSAQIL